MKKLFITFSFIFLYILTINCEANKLLNFRPLTPEKGLSHINVTSLLQDRHGYIWLGTNNGLNRFDGFTVKNFNSNVGNSKGLSSNRISTIYETTSGEIWVGTRDAGLNKYITRNDEFEHFLGKGHNVTTILEDGKHQLWFGELRKGLGMLDTESETANYYQPLDNKIIISNIYELNDHELLIGTRGNGIYIFNIEQKKYSRLKSTLDLTTETIRGFQTNGSAILVACFDKVLSLQIRSNHLAEIEQLPLPNSINAISSILFKNDFLWIGTKKGVYKVDVQQPEQHIHFQSDKQVVNSLINDNVNTILIDRSNVLWVGTTSGSCYANLQSIGLSTVHLNELHKENVNVVYEDSRGQIWFGLKNGTLLKYHNNKVVTYKNDPKSGYRLNTYGGIESLFEDPYGNLWIGSWGGGLTMISLEKEQLGKVNFKKIDGKFLTSNTITSIAYFDDALYVGTFRKGLVKLEISPKGDILSTKNYNKRKGKEFRLISNTVNYLYVDPFEKCLWISTPDGLEKVKRKGKKVVYKQYNITNINGQMTPSFCWEILRTSREELWVGTIENGLSRLTFDPKTLELLAVKTFTKEDGLASNSIQSLVYDAINTNLWIGGNGLTLLDTKTETTQVFNTKDGIEGGYFRVNCAKLLSDGRMVFASDQALNFILPGKIEANKFTPETIINKFYIYGREVHQGDIIRGQLIFSEPIEETKEITLEHFQNNIEIGYNAMHYGSAEKNTYQYKLDGFDKEWITTSRKRVVYSNLPFGEYTFKVKAANSDGIWEEKAQELHIMILTPWWRTDLAYCIYLVLIGLIIYKVNRMIINRHKLEQTLELERFKMEKNEELTLMKIRFFVNISHELRTPLTLISSPLETLLKDSNLTLHMKEYLDIMKRNSDRLLVLFDQLLDFRKIETGNHKVQFKERDIVNFTRLVSSSFNTLAKDNQINYAFHSHLDFQEAWIDEDIIEKSIYNLVSNAFKNTDEGGNILVELAKTPDDKFFTIVVSDTGNGISEEEQKHIFEEFYQTQNKTDRGTGLGLSLVKRLIEAHYGKITFESKEGEGTKFIITLPLSNDFMKEEEKVIEEVSVEDEKIESTTIVSEDLPKVLIVEDNMDIALYLKKELQSEFNIILAQNGKEGYEFVVKNQPDIVISDIMMAEMNGLELCKEIKKNPHLNHIPVILLTAKNTDEDKLEGIESGADAYIVKPFKTEFLLAKVMNLIEERRATKQFYAAKKEVQQLQEDPEKDKFLKKAQQTVEDNLLTEEFDSKMFAKKMGLTYATLYNRLKKYENESATGYIRKIRLHCAAELIANSDHSIKEIQFLVGFNDAKYFRTNFKKIFEITPSEYLKKFRKVDVKESL
ncbi:two-component regulator propeller domain-containing protein [Flammeovirga sp. SubArs3]|uniref:hybrid sensor histidine kinase/response regulator transcription factor n=1 Tax=Flammeovirga sp. SubArs3 TaxID=2995316 RepID=UPI00248C9991|nr:two-component regulator propeller domain-containing protein [Flammeovirga sp. SubArs3]